MTLTLFSINLMMSAIFMMLTHPLSLGLVLLAQTILISLITGNFNYNFWYSYILFLILVGGMLILFMYMTSIASNEKFNFNIKLTIPMLAVMLTLMMSTYWLEINMNNNESMNMISNQMINFSLNKYINFPSNMIMMFMIIFLFMALVATVKITKFKKGPLRQMN